MYHWDLPQSLQDAGGWESEKIVEWFADYARLCYDLFGNDVKYWMTFNEPSNTCRSGYGGGYFAPGIQSSGIGEYLCTHNLLKAHAAAWHIYDDEYRQEQKGFKCDKLIQQIKTNFMYIAGKVGIVIDSSWFQPETNSSEDLIATETALQFTVRLLAKNI